MITPDMNTAELSVGCSKVFLQTRELSSSEAAPEILSACGLGFRMLLSIK